MEFDRVVQVRARTSQGDWLFGTGYLIAPRLVLTAAHVLGVGGGDGGARPVTVSGPDGGAGSGAERFPATVAWCRDDGDDDGDGDGLVDAALIEVDPGTGWQPPASLRDPRDLRARPPQRWGRLIGVRPHPATACGFPRMQKSTAGRLREQFEGTVRPGTGTGATAGRYEILSADPVLPYPARPGSGVTGWSGISGAALLCGDQLTGVVRSDRQASGGTRLTATRARDLIADPAFRALVARHTGWDPLLEPVEPAHLLAPAARVRDLRSPAALLRADSETVAFHGRDHELRQLTDWCLSDQDTFAVRVLTGPGGQGKSRLARHLVARLRERGWVAAHLLTNPADEATAPDSDLTSLDTSLPLLLVVDYAETAPRQLRRLIDHLRRARHRTRLLLLARGEGDWKHDVLGAGPDTRAILAAAPATELGPLLARTATPEQRAAAYAAAAADLARLLPQVPGLPQADWDALATTLRPPADLAHARYDSALTLQMTALAALLQHGPAPVDSAPAQPVEAVLLDHEARYWHGTAQAPMFRLDLREVTVRRAVAAAVAFGAADQAEALAIAERIPGLPPGRALDVAEWLRALYPPAPDRYWGSLQPDRLAEYQASSQLTGSGTPMLTTLWTSAAATQQTQALTVLARAAVAHANATRSTSATDVLHALRAALDTATPNLAVLQSAAAALPRHSRTLAHLALRLDGDLTAAHRRLAEADPDAYERLLAMSLNNLSARLGEVGRRAESLAVGEEAVAIRRRLAEADPEAYESVLAMSLNNLSVQFGEVGRWAEGLAASEETVRLYRRLAEAEPEAHELALAQSLNNLSNRFGELGRWAEGLAASEEAVGLYRRLAEADPDAHESDLAMSLNNLSNRLGELGRGAEGLAAIQEANARHRRLAEADPDAYEPILAGSLTNLGVRFGELGRRAEGLAAIQEAVGLYRRLAEVDPDAYEPDLATSLNNLSNQFGALGRHAEGLAAIQEAAGIGRSLAAVNPDAYQPALATSLNNLSNRLGDVGRWMEGLAASEEAAGLLRRLAAVNPEAYEPALATSLTNLANRLGEVGRWAESLATSEEAAAIGRSLAAVNPDAYQPALATSLNSLSNGLGEVGRWVESLAVSGETTGLLRRLATANPDAYEPALALSLSNLSIRFGKVERWAEGLAACEEATVIRRRLAAANPEAYAPALASSLWATAWTLVGGDRNLPRALEAATEAVEILAGLAAQSPAAHGDRLQGARATLAEVLQRMEETGA